MNSKYVFVGSLCVSWVGTAANWATEAKSILGALAALASVVASCYAIAAARRKLFTAKNADQAETKISEVQRKERKERKGSKKNGARGGPRRAGTSPYLTGRRLMLALLVPVLLFAQGCTHVGKKMERTRVRFEKHEEVLKEESRALTTGVVDALQMAPTSPETDLAKSLAVADQEIEGLPLKRLPVSEALSGDTNAAVMIDERVKAIEALRIENARLAEDVRATEEKLVRMGVQFEAERNARLKFWTKWLSAGTLAIGGCVALFVFCPVALPIVGRLLGWAVGKVPALAGAVGVVGKDAFDAVVRGVGNARDAMKKSGAAELGMLDTHLRIETDAAHKELIEARRVAVGA